MTYDEYAFYSRLTSRHVIFYNVSLNPRLDQVIRLAYANL